jgi:hypothetical protein
MAAFHDSIATYCGDSILTKIRSSDADFKQVFSPSIIRTGDWDWPRPDYVCFDEQLKATYALEFKPPFQSKREYLTGLGQSFAYLQKHTYSGLIVPTLADDNFRIADFIKETLTAPEFASVTVSLFAYDQNTFDIDILRPITQSRLTSVSVSKYEDTKTFWSWWRDMSQYELYDLLNLSFLFGDFDGDIYSDKIYPAFYARMSSKRTRQWDGKPRNKSSSAASMKSEKQNYKIPLVQLDLWSRNECRLTTLGFELLQTGKLYGAGSTRFLDKLAYLILVNGRHLDLINMIDKFQKQGGIPQTSKDFILLLENFLTERGCIGKRKPSAITTGAKISYLRDEPKLWNKLDLLEMKNGSSYFYPGEGFRFNWERISGLLLSED